MSSAISVPTPIPTAANAKTLRCPLTRLARPKRNGAGQMGEACAEAQIFFGGTGGGGGGALTEGERRGVDVAVEGEECADGVVENKDHLKRIKSLTYGKNEARDMGERDPSDPRG